MNTSYSKRRHIQEANQRLEKRTLNEQPDDDDNDDDNIWNVGTNRDENDDLIFRFDEKHVLLRDLTQKKVQHYLSKLPETVKYLVIMDCQGVDFSDVDICSYNQLRHINLEGTPNNFDEFNNCRFEEWKPQFYSR